MKKSSYVLGGAAVAVAGLVARSRSRNRKTVGTDGPAEEPHQQSMTALAGEALRSGTLGQRRGRDPEVPHEDELLQAGDPNVHPLDAAYVGDETPGGTTPTPDQDRIDDVGRAYGLAEEDSGALRSGEEILQERDRRRSE